ncbi:carbohydrate kinase [Rhizobium sp. Root274]|uniref:carbohydrate kinase family protein n=1 Tax=unclassified Rhizobium TaxID=2613769 RepID=UPI000714BD95|nr:MULTISPECIES: carbohydrate kinase family protein [unclassified Rhizobium]KQW28693.1 carbohydrate kinase [Rhizobium sp. Root1240]KRD28891.1 carbohydrate kinase [Rhizobium sp. Root274]
MTVEILAIGGAHLDRRARISGDTKPGASNPGRWFEEPGGGVFNAARNLARLGRAVRLIAPRGGDAAGQAVADAAERAGIEDWPVMFLDRATPSYTAILENDGNLVIALADMALYDAFVARRLRARSMRESLTVAGHVLCDANLPPETLSALAASAARLGRGVSAIAISPAKVVRLRGAFPNLDHLFMNGAEAEAIAGKRADQPEDWPNLLRACGLRGGSVTSGSGRTIAFDAERIAVIEPATIETIGDVTGAGDAFASGFLHARLAGGDLCEGLRLGTACAAITLASPHATDENLSAARLDTQLSLVPPARFLP